MYTLRHLSLLMHASMQIRLGNGTIAVTAKNFPMYLYDRPYNPDKPDDGLLRGPFPARVSAQSLHSL